MNKHLKLFANHSAYSQAESNLDKPNVAVCLLEGDVHYNPYVDPYNGHAYVDLGLPSGTKWATMNVGATKPEEYGLYFQWGDTQGYTASEVGSGEGKKAFGWGDYKWSKNGGSTMSKYNSTDGKTVLDIEDDAVATNWGGSWKMPTVAQFQELFDNTTYEWTTISNINGYKFTSKTDNSKYIFIPTAGRGYNGRILYVGNRGYVWSSSLYSSDVQHGHEFNFDSYDISVARMYRHNGQSVRGVVSQ